MSNYFDNLVAKTLGLTPAVQPRLASLFEPPHLANQPTANADQFSVEPDQEQSQPTVQARAEKRGSVDLPLKAESRETAATGNRHETILEAPLRPPKSIFPQRFPQEFDQRKDANPAPQLIPSRSTLTALSSGNASGVEPQERKEQATNQEQSPVSLLLQPPNSPIRQSLLVAEAPPLIPAGEAENLETPTRAGLVIHPHIQPVIRANAAEVRARESSPGSATQPSVESHEHREQAPTIKITIGRVDVRAVMTPQPAPRPAPERRPARSLDEYLRERQGGQR